MRQTLEKAVLEDELAVSMARAVAAANERARREGVDVKKSLVTAEEMPGAGELCWRITYGPRDYVNSRGGDLVIDIDTSDGSVRQVLRGQ